MSHWFMPLKVMDLVDQRLAILNEPQWSGRSVAQVCARHGISRETFYDWRRRYDTDGLAGLIPLSRRPDHSPAQLDPGLEDRIVALRKQHGWGPGKIRDALRREGLPTPAASTVQQVLARRGHGGDPRRRTAPAAASHRFTREACNDLWQIDGAHHRLTDTAKTAFWSVEIIDDHSRFCLAIVVGLSLTGFLAWTAMTAAAAAYGLPAWLLSDNGRCFTGRLDGQTVTFERRVREAGIGFTHSRPYHPQTCGKVERLHRTQRDWLARRPAPTTLTEAAELMTRFREHYNHQRPHQALNGATPADIYQPGTPIQLPITDLQPADHYPTGAVRRKTSDTGRFAYARQHFDLGERFAHITVGVVRDHARLHVYYGSALIDTYLVGTKLPTPTR
jgi:transposase InsO family protein